MKTWLGKVTVVALAVSATCTFAQQGEGKKVDIFPKDTRTYTEKEQARSEAQAKKGYEALQREKQAEQMRDKTHDNRLKTGANTSLEFKPIHRV